MFSKYHIFDPTFIPLYQRIPELLVVELKEELEIFFEETANIHECDYDLDVIVKEIMMFISDNNFVTSGLQMLKTNITDCHSQANGYAPDDGEALGNATYKLGLALFQKFNGMNAYLNDGTLPFEFSRWIDYKTLLPVPVFKKCLDYST